MPGGDHAAVAVRRQRYTGSGAAIRPSAGGRAPTATRGQLSGGDHASVTARRDRAPVDKHLCTRRHIGGPTPP
ncbi:hypothetical protein ACQEVX_00795 [Streptomyces syringium]|uniref:hypothetical protein n=1 Tax=Streptomyces syringium TaxID=76729 RepID=UPI003D8D4B8F